MHTLIRRLAPTLAVIVCLAACPRPPVPQDGSVATPSSWTDTARVVLDTLRWAIPAARTILDAILGEPARTTVGRALAAVTDYSGRLNVALQAYEARGGDRCAAHAAAGGLGSALVDLAQVLADHGVALGVPLGRVVDSVAALVDTLLPACQADAGFLSTSDGANTALRRIETAARVRGTVLRRDLDAIRP